MKEVKLIGVEIKKAFDTKRVFLAINPPIHSGVFNIVEIQDPWHKDAFVGTPAEGVMGSSGERKKVWYGEDWCGNLIGEYGECEYGKPGDQLGLKFNDQITPVLITDIQPIAIHGTTTWAWEISFDPNVPTDQPQPTE